MQLDDTFRGQLDMVAGKRPCGGRSLNLHHIRGMVASVRAAEGLYMQEQHDRILATLQGVNFLGGGQDERQGDELRMLQVSRLKVKKA